MAQAALESAWGESKLTSLGNNLFGIKGKGDAGSGTYLTKEFVDGKYIQIEAEFAHYSTWGASVAAHTSLLLKSRYAPFRAAKSYVEAAQKLHECGYATDPKYPEKLIGLIEKYGLQKFDEGSEEVDKVKTIVTDGAKMWEREDSIVYEGKTYIPAAILKAEGILVDWDGKNKKIIIHKEWE